MNIGIIGLGIMGGRMAGNLQGRGHALVLFNRTREKAGALLAKGASFADSPAALASQVEVVFTMLAHPDAVEAAALGGDGFLSHLRQGTIWIDCSTVNPSFSRRMAAAGQARGVRFLDAPVTGSKTQAALANLTSWVGGDAADLETARPLLECMADTIVYCGGEGMGASMKMVMDQLLGTEMAAFAEGLALGESLGLPRGLLLRALLSAPVAAPFLAVKRGRIESGHYEDADFPMRWLHKDLHLATLSAYESGAAAPLTSLAKAIYGMAIRNGRGGQDFSAICTHFTAGRCELPTS